MIAVAVSFLLALYVLGPDAVSRFLLGFTVPRRAVLLTKSEEISRALVWAVSCLGLAFLWGRWSGAFAQAWRPDALRIFFSGLYSETFFRSNQAAWFASLRPVFWMNWTLLWRTYLLVILLSVVLTWMTQFYGVVWGRLPHGFVRELFTALVLPRVAQWHVLLSKLLLPNRRLVIQLDILTKSDKLYQGTFFDKALSADGSLISVTLASPKRFDRAAYTRAKDEGVHPNPAEFWKSIPTNMFVVMASDINTINFRYTQPVQHDRLQLDSPELRQLLEQIADKVNRVRAQEHGESTSASPS